MPDRLVILNVDDNEAPRYTKTRQLQEAGFQVVEAVSGYDALKKVEELQPRVVLLDVQLPDLDGIAVCGRIKGKWPRVMVLQTSATFTSGADRTRGLEGGADGYLTQPIEPGELVAAVRALLRLSQAEDQLRLLNTTLEERVLERTHELEQANERLKSEIAQRQKAEAALVQAQKMEAIGQLTGGIAHDFNNLLTAVVGNLDLLRNRVGDARLHRLAENAYKAAQRGSKLTSQLLAFSRSQQLVVAATDVRALVLGMSDLLTQTLGPSVSVAFNLPEDLPRALADANQLELAVLNLAINARDAMEAGGTLHVEARVYNCLHGETDLPPGRYVEILFSDNGSGMPPDVLAKAFDPFFTTKPPGRGTGLGLSQVYGILKQIGGNVRLTSEQGHGTTVCLRLVSTERDEEMEVLSEAGTDKRGHSERLLVIDDDRDVRSFLVELLQEAGYEVHEAGEPEKGLQKTVELDPDLVLLDFAMPGLNGAEFIQAARARDPSLRILLLSGYADMQALDLGAKVPILRKPFEPDVLLGVIRTELKKSVRPH